MHDELHLYCKLEGFSEETLRARARAEDRLLRLEKRRKRSKKRRTEKCKGLEEAEEPENLLALSQ